MEKWRRFDEDRHSRQKLITFLGSVNGANGSFEHLSEEAFEAVKRIEQKWFLIWDDILPLQLGDQRHRLAFLSSEYPTKFIEKIKDEKKLSDQVVDLKAIKYPVYENVGSLMVNYLDMSDDEKVFNWVGGSNESVVRFLNYWTQSSILHTELENLITSEAIFKIIDNGISPEMLVKFMQGVPIEKIIRDVEDYAIIANYYKGGESWQSAFEVFGVLNSRWGYLIDQKKLEDLAVEIYSRGNKSKSQDEYGFRDRVMVRKLLAPVEFKLRSAYNEQNPENGLKINRRMSKRVAEDQIDVVEDSRFVLSGLLPTLGYEIEHEENGAKSLHYDLIDELGWSKSTIIEDHMREFSPGPFFSYKTGQYVFWSYWQAGFIDLHSAWGQSVHLNLGLKDMYGMIAFNRLLMATGWATHPKTVDDLDDKEEYFYTADRNDQKLRIFYKNTAVPRVQYIESKEFCLTTPVNFLKFLRSSQLMAGGLGQLQAAMGEYKSRAIQYGKKPIFPRVEDEDWMNYDFETQRRAIQNSSLAYYQKKIALNYLLGIKTFEKGLQSLKVDGIMSPFAPIDQVGEFMKLMRQVYPDHWSWHERTSGQVISKPFTVDGVEYPNMVNFARRITTKTTKGIEKLLDDAVEDFRMAARIVVGENDKAKRLKLINRMVERFGIWDSKLLVNDADLDERVYGYLKQFVDKDI